MVINAHVNENFPHKKIKSVASKFKRVQRLYQVYCHGAMLTDLFIIESPPPSLAHYHMRILIVM